MGALLDWLGPAGASLTHAALAHCRFRRQATAPPGLAKPLRPELSARLRASALALHAPSSSALQARLRAPCRLPGSQGRYGNGLTDGDSHYCPGLLA